MIYKKLAAGSIIVNVCLVLFFIGKRLYFAHSAPAPSDASASAYYDNYNEGRSTVLESLPIDTADFVFVGNSLTEQFPLQEMFHSLHIKNRGIGGNQTRHILERIRPIAQAHPRAILFEMGVNDIRDHVPIPAILANYDSVVDLVRSLSPNTMLYVQAVFPVTGKYQEFQLSIDSLNIQLLAFCRYHRVPLLYCNELLSKYDYLDSTVTFDGLHLNGKGYRIWKQQLEPIIRSRIPFRE